VLGACGDASPDADDARAGDAGGLVVVAELAPIADLVAEVLGDRGRVHSLVPNGADAHTHQPRPSDVRRITGAVAFFGVGLSLNDGALRLVTENLPDGAPVVLLAEEALGPGDLRQESFGHTHGDGGAHSHGDGAGHSHGDGAGHGHGDEEVAGAANPHVWVDPTNAMAMVEVIRDELSDIDPDGAVVYAANAADLLERIGELDAAIAEAVATVPAAARKLVVYHDAWTYFGAHYGLEVIAALQPVDLSEPSAREVGRIIRQIEAEGVPTVFGSAEFPSDVLEQIAETTGATYEASLSDDELPAEPGDPEHSYLGLLHGAARTIVVGLGGDPTSIDAVTLDR
jgi:ABC-type Zn uptake system ZnuABC Zn-binding protein ZnuA